MMKVAHEQEEFTFMIKERIETKKHIPTEEELAKEEKRATKQQRDISLGLWNYSTEKAYPEYDYIRTGELGIHIADQYVRGARRSWKDGKTRKMEDLIEEIAIGMVAYLAGLKVKREERENWHRQWERDTITQWIERVELRQDSIRIKLSLTPFIPDMQSSATITQDIPMRMRRRGVEMRLVIGGTGTTRTDHTMIKTVAFAHGWFQDLLSGRAKNIAEIALREGVDRSDINRRLSLAFLSPEIVDAIVTGQQPADLLTEKLIRRIDLPLEWAEQRLILNFC